MTVRDLTAMCTFSPRNIPALQGAWASDKVSSAAPHIWEETLPYFFSIANASFPPSESRLITIHLALPL